MPFFQRFGAAAVLLALLSAPASAQGVIEEPLLAMRLQRLAGGTFVMGDFAGAGTAKERPAHPVTVSDFYLSLREVTVGQFRTFVTETGYRTEAERAGGVIDIDSSMNSLVRRPEISWSAPGFAQGPDGPVVWVSWNDARAFVSWLARRTGRPYSLPTEAQWEYAAREGGRTMRWAGTSTSLDLPRFAWYASNSGGAPRDTATREPNGLGLYDMSGNVWEWCLDWQEDYPPPGAEPPLDPAGPPEGRFKALRGGSWRVGDETVTTTYRNGYRPEYAHSSIGFRVALPAGDGGLPPSGEAP